MSIEKCEICKIYEGFSCRKPTVPLVPGRLKLRENQPMEVIFERIEDCSIRRESQMDGHGEFLTFVDTENGETVFFTVDPRNIVSLFGEQPGGRREFFGPFDSQKEVEEFIGDYSRSQGFAPLDPKKEDSSK